MSRLLPLRFCAALLCAVPAVSVVSVSAAQAQLQITGFHQAVAENAARDDVLAEFYRERGFDGIWTGSDPEVINRRNALLFALSEAHAHGLPAGRYDVEGLIERLHAAKSTLAQGGMEVELSRAFLDYARDVNTGILAPRQVVSAIKREVPLIDKRELLEGFLAARSPQGYLRGLAPQSPEYTRLMRRQLELRAQIETGGWGPTVTGGALRPGDTGDRVVTLRNRLMAMGYLGRSVTQTYDAEITAAVERLQAAHGITVDGVASGATLEAINTPASERLQSVLVAMERERWMNIDRGDRHIWVNLTDFHASIVDFDRVTFTTRSVIGATTGNRETPEFSDIMSHMVINPSWYVPRSIIVGTYSGRVPAGFQAIGSSGPVNVSNVIVNGQVRYGLRQLPGPRNALGSVKFMFPNQYNIYLHDTPAQDLFAREVRAFSHGCIRLDDPHDFAYELLSAQESDPEGFFNSILNTRAERRVNLEEPVPVHLVYRTAFTSVTGELQFRNDIYGRDARIWAALAAAGVEIGGVQG
ncbi:L,D-transpeptidase family protein [Ponticoccus sp. SC2-23]|uniref:L,D-transpeptidase family protein n=1 Tax=Alexandriicola marinus TaxID=2081710 RepID=UPI000FD7EEA7|nr:L,D-transpeptidase family protein [Alexandriicola marinus]MBM1218941.1 L,D-transpeptidase family protein [Ponticoccus sp. SC6-9]MBM1223987.1 L,D-transpeptidase family protein [Ponticoccus sp. SC6-15]MBM1230234.1 L,D-transpeptidase family protein [Ponticoccus sp. SC6-38]MBM1232953.1 L,D-transpeptidase family protein [Ponticoccus sp. SC6-45]MBM1237097.1 L,D-transpeptidase family protein [Ponticoccus sp. SC6-49]MBM1241964.1 L,D-transpeptidase family protein [Ponticoccus sp. SC2-64]MBM1246477